MGLTPAEIRHVRLGRGFFGYRRGPTDQLVDEVVQSFEEVWRERADFADKIEHLEEELVRFKELELLLRQTLVSAERASNELRSQAKREAEVIVEEAHTEARAILNGARLDRERMRAETHKMRTQLAAALAVIEEAEEGSTAEAA